ncbi:MAG: hypothetical protein U5L45_01140 [Saprospiraceae bacterium]|nr:hypothetical protein [Saprospiraceae bacterium]
MKPKIIIAFASLLIGLTATLDWVVFSVNNGNLAFNDLKTQYIARFPAAFAAFYANNIGLVTFVLFLLLMIAGSLFLTEKRGLYKILGTVASVLGAWQLLSLM